MDASPDNGKQRVPAKDVAEDEMEQLEKVNKAKTWMTRFSGVIMITALVAVFIILALSDINFGQWLADITLNFWHEYGTLGIYLGVFVISIFGNFTVIFPVPYTIALIVISAVVPGVNPFLLGLPAGIGAAIGETSAWVAGRGTQSMLENSPRIQRMKSWIDAGWADFLVLLFAATPLPDDSFLIVLGFSQYPLWRALIWCFVGKWILCFTTSAITIWAADTAWGQSAIGLFGIDIEAARAGTVPEGTTNIWTSTITWILTLAATFAIVFVDWGKLIQKLKKNKDKSVEDVNAASGVAQFLPLARLSGRRGLGFF